jgi:glyoxylase-like metal-dependent hydrolase (beta-lactamase superfamily II)
MVTPRITRYADGIAAIDAQYLRDGHAAVHILQHEGRAAFIDTGTNHSVPYLLAALEELSITRDAVDYVLLTHVHLDHAGGAGQLMQALPNAKAVLHPRGAPHMIDPARLISASIAVYGEENYRNLYGELLAIPAERIIITSDMQRLALAGRPLEFVHTPGHALHHHAIVDLNYGNIFSGDTFGISYRECDTAKGAFIAPTTTPSQFDPEQLIHSVKRLAAYEPKALFLTHYARVEDVPRLAHSMEQQINEFVVIGERHRLAPQREQRMAQDMRQMWQDMLREHGCTFSNTQFNELFDGDVELNVAGIVNWMDRAAAKAQR